MKQVLVDMDGVLADVYTQFQNYEKEEYGKVRPLEELIGKLELEAFPHGDKYVRSKGFFQTAPIIPDSIEGLKYLNDKYKVLIVSSATEFPDSLREKLSWLNTHFPFISWKQMIFCGEKNSIKGDIMIDDHPKNLDFFDGQKILFTQPHNMLLDVPEYIRVGSWREIMDSTYL